VVHPEIKDLLKSMMTSIRQLCGLEASKFDATFLKKNSSPLRLPKKNNFLAIKEFVFGIKRFSRIASGHAQYSLVGSEIAPAQVTVLEMSVQKKVCVQRSPPFGTVLWFKHTFCTTWFRQF
jgi:hypothetical protein